MKKGIAKLRFDLKQLREINAKQAEEISELQANRYIILNDIKAKKTEIEELKRNENRAQSYIHAACDTLKELRGVLISAKFVDDKPKTAITFSPNDYYLTPMREPQKTEFTDRDEIMVRFEHINNQINSIRIR